MLYIATTKTLSAQQNLSLSDGDDLLVFYKENDSVRMADLARLISSGMMPTMCEPVEGRDDMLVLLGGFLAKTDDSVTLLDATIPIPKRYADRIRTAKPTTKTRKRKTAAKPAADGKEASAQKGTPVKEEKKDPDGAEEGHHPNGEPRAGGFMNRPEGVPTEPSEKPAATKGAPKRKENDSKSIEDASYKANAMEAIAEYDGENRSDEPEEKRISLKEKWAKKMEGNKAAQASLTEAIHTEDNPKFTDQKAEKLYAILGVKSSEVGFHWPTEMLMLSILSSVADSETDEDLEMSIRAKNNGDKLWEHIKSHTKEIRKLAQEK